MPTEDTVFDQTVAYYLERIRGLSLDSVAPRIGGDWTGHAVRIPFFGRDYEVSAEAIRGPSGERPSHDICVILSRCLLMCPDHPTDNKGWVSFRNLKDSGPLIHYFSHDVEGRIAAWFSHRLDDLKRAGEILGGYRPDLDAKYDFMMQCNALPRIPVILLFNDGDSEFPATCSVLFESRVETYLDAECIAMVGGQLFRELKEASGVSPPRAAGPPFRTSG